MRRFFALPLWRMSGIILRCIGVFLARRETGLIEQLLLAWMSLLLILGGFWIQNLDTGGATTPQWMIVGEFMVRTLLMSVSLPVVEHWTSMPTGSRTRINPRKRRGKKKRKRKETWFGRRQRARWRKRVDKTERWGWDGSPSEWIENWMRDHAHRYLDTQHYAKYFERLCMINPDLIDILTGSSTFGFMGCRETNVLDWGFLDVAGPLTDTPTEDIDLGDRVLPSRILQDGLRFQSVFFTNDDKLPVVFDTGATISVSPQESDFISWEARGDLHTKLNGITASTDVLGVGIVRWTIRDDGGRRRQIETRAYYVPSARVRLLSPQRYLHEQQSGQFIITPRGSIFTFPGNDNARLTFQMWDDTTFRSELPVAFVVPRTTDFERAHDQAYLGLNVLDPENVNLSNAQKELMLWHFKLGHFHLEWIQKLFRVREGDVEAILPSKHKANACKLPQCAACHFGKMHLRATEATTEKKVAAKDGSLKANHLKPGDMVSTDQYVSKELGRLPHTRGKESLKERYVGGTIYVDEASGFVFAQHQVSLNAMETIRGKHLFEREAGTCGVQIRNYRGDNGVYKSTEFVKDLNQRNQTIRYCGVGAHHSNGIAERAIRTISESARSMILHAAIHWPEETTMDLWPLAMDYAIYLWNRMPRKDSGFAPMEIFCGCKLDKQILRNCHVWGCPTYVLDPRIQDGKKLPRWQPKSRRGQFLGFSKRHASTVGLIRNIKTGSISPQFHVVFDDGFTTVPSRVSDNNITPPANWLELLTFSRMFLTDEDEDENTPIELNDEWLSEQEINAKRNRDQRFRRNQVIQGVQRQDPEQQLPEEENENEVPEQLAPLFDDNDDDADDGDDQGDYWQPRHQRRRWVPNKRYFGEDFENRANLNRQAGYTAMINDFGLLTDEEAFIANLGVDGVFDGRTIDSQLEQMEVIESYMTDEEGLLTTLHPLAFAAKANNEDTPNFHQAMNGPDAEGYYEAMEKEMEQLEEKNPWDEIPIETVPEGANILDSTWAFKRKRFPDGRVRKLKARFCVRGDQQIEGVDFFDTFAPVVAWSTVRLLLILSVILGLATKQVDYTLAFVQADLEDDVYVRMPKLFERPGYVYKLKKSVYGLRQAPLNFFLSLKDGLEARGFVQSKYDPCLFVSEKVICLCYVDDCLFFAKDDADIVDVIESLRRPEPTKFDLNIEDDVAGFLGILMQKRENGTIELIQTGLIDRILKVMALEDSHEKSTPSDVRALGKDEGGEPCSEPWSYASVVGMMMYLASNSRPDIAYAVHSCARFTHCPKRVHEKALKRIARYLKATRERGMIIQPTGDLSMELYVDADFAGLWSSEKPDDSMSVKSRTGFIIMIGGTPVVWSSKLQTEIALSTCEAEYIALSTAMRSLLPLRELFHSLAESMDVKRDEITKVCAVWEDNNAALKLANAQFPNMTPRTKHIAIKYHWFKEHIIDGEIEVRPIDTKIQKADIFTKGIAKKEFEEKRAMIMGW